MNEKNIVIRYRDSDGYISLYPATKFKNVSNNENKTLDKVLEEENNLIQSLIHKYNDLKQSVEKLEKNKIKIEKFSTTLSDKSNTANIGSIIGKNDDILIYQNAVYIENGKSYKLDVSNDKIISLEGEWQQGTIFNFIIIRNGKE